MNRMDIRKQLDGLIKKEDIDSKDIQWALAILEVLRDYGIKRVVDEENKIQQYTKLESEDLGNIKAMIKLLEKIDNKLNNKPDPKGDISNIGRDKLDEWAKRNEKLDTKNEEKVLGAIAGAFGDDE
jgi:hypothetical protein